MPDNATPPAWTWWHTTLVIALALVFVLAGPIVRLGLYVSWITTMVSLFAFTLVVGHGVTGTWKGAFVDDRNRMSLSRFQMVLWTVLVVSAFGAIAVGRLTQVPLTESDALNALNIGVPSTIWLLLGISTASFIGSPLIKSVQKDPALQPPVKAPQADAGAAQPDRPADTSTDKLKSPAGTTIEGLLVKNNSIDDATFADMFMGETYDNAAHLDVGKMQMFFFTVLLLFVYGFAIAALLRSTAAPGSLPDVGSGMLPLLGLSHGGYLMSKSAQGKLAQPEVANG